MTTLTLITYEEACRVASSLAVHHGVEFTVQRNSWTDESHDLWDVAGPEGFVFQRPAWYSEPPAFMFSKWQTLLDSTMTNDNN